MQFIITLVVAIPVGMFLMEYMLEGDDQTMGQFALTLIKHLVKHS